MYYVLLKLWKTGIGFCYLILVITIMSLGLVQAVANCTSSVSFLLTLSRIRFLYSQKTMDA